ncbi:hypothetical protein E2320_006293 [Naja naja]|nr:hypothetical protein E2320_006293 [Naja naja]
MDEKANPAHSLNHISLLWAEGRGEVIAGRTVPASLPVFKPRGNLSGGSDAAPLPGRRANQERLLSLSPLLSLWWLLGPRSFSSRLKPLPVPRFYPCRPQVPTVTHIFPDQSG